MIQMVCIIYVWRNLKKNIACKREKIRMARMVMYFGLIDGLLG